MTIAIWVWFWVGMQGRIDLPFHLTVFVSEDSSHKILSCQSDSIVLTGGICDGRTRIAAAPPSQDGVRIPIDKLELKCEPQKKGVKLWINCKTD